MKVHSDTNCVVVDAQVARLEGELADARRHWKRCEQGWNRVILQAEGFQRAIAAKDAALRGEDRALLEVGRKAVEDLLIEFRDQRISEFTRGNGLVIREKDGEDSSIIRFGPETALKVGMKAIYAALSDAGEGWLPPAAKVLLKDISGAWLGAATPQEFWDKFDDLWGRIAQFTGPYDSLKRLEVE